MCVCACVHTRTPVSSLVVASALLLLSIIVQAAPSSNLVAAGGKEMNPGATFRMLGFLHVWMMALNRQTAVCCAMQACGCCSRDGQRAGLG